LDTLTQLTVQNSIQHGIKIESQKGIYFSRRENVGKYLFETNEFLRSQSIIQNTGKKSIIPQTWNYQIIIVKRKARHKKVFLIISNTAKTLRNILPALITEYLKPIPFSILNFTK